MKRAARNWRHGIALDKHVTVILSQSDAERPLCGIYFNLHSPYQKQSLPRTVKPLEDRLVKGGIKAKTKVAAGVSRLKEDQGKILDCPVHKRTLFPRMNRERRRPAGGVEPIQRNSPAGRTALPGDARRLTAGLLEIHFWRTSSPFSTIPEI